MDDDNKDAFDQWWEWANKDRATDHRTGTSSPELWFRSWRRAPELHLPPPGQTRSRRDAPGLSCRTTSTAFRQRPLPG
jgi:hypothetical protein